MTLSDTGPRWSRHDTVSGSGIFLITAAAACTTNGLPGAPAVPGQSEAVDRYCAGARDYLGDRLGNPTLVDPDTIQDWRTRQSFFGCRVYAAASTAASMSATAQQFYEALVASGWIRTPDARDMPNEAAIRLRKDGMDCLYHVYNGPLLNTPSEQQVIQSVDLGPDDQLFNILAQCMPAMDAAPDEEAGAPQPATSATG